VVVQRHGDDLRTDRVEEADTAGPDRVLADDRVTAIHEQVDDEGERLHRTGGEQNAVFGDVHHLCPLQFGAQEVHQWKVAADAPVLESSRAMLCERLHRRLRHIIGGQ
jgi:hypothetical protein